jgi:pimeloyl-ACP methyl ester carboxylesterase
MSYWNSVATLIDLGAGVPLVLVPGIQGRWEWMRPAAEALAKRTRVLTFSLCGDPDSGYCIDPVLGFDSFVAQVDAALERARVTEAAVCGVSYGGLIAVRYAAVRPQRVTCLILTSSPGPTWRPDARARRYVRTPWLHAPAFALNSGRGLWPEISSAFPPLAHRLRFAASHLGRVLASRIAPRMSQRVARRRQLRCRRIPRDGATLISPASRASTASCRSSTRECCGHRRRQGRDVGAHRAHRAADTGGQVADIVSTSSTPRLERRAQR